MEKTLIYFNKKKLLLYSAIALLIAAIAGYGIYKEIFFDFIYTKISSFPKDRYAFLGYQEVPFEFPRSLLRPSIYTILVFLISVISLINFIKQLFIKKPYLIFSQNGIEHFKYGLIKWNDVEKIERSKSKDYDILSIKLKNPQRYFGRYKTFFGNRRITVNTSIHSYENTLELHRPNNPDLLTKQ